MVEVALMIEGEPGTASISHSAALATAMRIGARSGGKSNALAQWRGRLRPNFISLLLSRSARPSGSWSGSSGPEVFSRRRAWLASFGSKVTTPLTWTLYWFLAERAGAVRILVPNARMIVFAAGLNRRKAHRMTSAGYNGAVGALG